MMKILSLWPLAMCALMAGCYYPLRSFQESSVAGASAQAVFDMGDLSSGTTKDGVVVSLSEAVPAGEWLCRGYVEPPCIAVSELKAVTISKPPRMGVKEWAIQSPLIVLGVALSPLYLLPTPRQPGWLEKPDNPCIASGEAVTAKGDKAEAAALVDLTGRYRELSGLCLLNVSGVRERDALGRRMWFMSVARLRFESLACVDAPEETPYRPQWAVPMRDQMQDAQAVAWPNELRAVLNDPGTYDYPGLERVCRARGGVREERADAIAYARQAWPLPTPL